MVAEAAGVVAEAAVGAGVAAGAAVAAGVGLLAGGELAVTVPSSGPLLPANVNHKAKPTIATPPPASAMRALGDSGNLKLDIQKKP